MTDLAGNFAGNLGDSAARVRAEYMGGAVSAAEYLVSGSLSAGFSLGFPTSIAPRSLLRIFLAPK